MPPSLINIAPKAWMSLHQLGGATVALHYAQERARREPDDNTLLKKLDGNSHSQQRPGF